MDVLDDAEPGRRWVLRHRLPDGSATDVIGWLVGVAPDTVALDTGHAEVTIRRADILLARRAPAARGGRDPLRTTAEELERIARAGWMAASEPLGEWTLRAAGGFTGRANSCLAVGDPGCPIAEAAGRIVAYARSHGIAPMAQAVIDSEPDLALRRLGWTETYVRTDVLVSRLGDLLGDGLPHPRVAVSDTLSDAWFAAYGRSRPTDADPATVRAILDGQPPHGFAAITESGRIVAIGRGHVHLGWLGVAAVWTDPASRGRGYAGLILTALGHWGARRGARNVYLQVDAANEAAHRAYGRLGFVRHHQYGYLAPVE